MRCEVRVKGPGEHEARFWIERDEAPQEGEVDHADPLSSMTIHFKVLRLEDGVIHAEWHPRPGPPHW